MSDLIDRQLAIDAICGHGADLERRGITDLSVAYHKRVTVDLLEELSSAQPERKKGEWMWDGEPRREYPYKCSECGEIDYYAFLYDAETREYKQQDKFCPNCGADMRGGEK